MIGSELNQSDDETITVPQKTQLQTFEEKNITGKLVSEDVQPDLDADATEIHKYRLKGGQMLYIGLISNLVILHHASHRATKVNSLWMPHLEYLCEHFWFYKQRAPERAYVEPRGQSIFTLEVVADSSMSSTAEGGGEADTY